MLGKTHHRAGFSQLEQRLRFAGVTQVFNREKSGIYTIFHAISPIARRPERLAAHFVCF
jgi:hypothetical protein